MFACIGLTFHSGGIMINMIWFINLYDEKIDLKNLSDNLTISLFNKLI